MKRRSDKLTREDLEVEICDLRSIQEGMKRSLREHEEAVKAIFRMHSPHFALELGGSRIVARCHTCQSSERHGSPHHMWPCPTAARVLAYAVYEEKSADEPGVT